MQPGVPRWKGDSCFLQPRADLDAHQTDALAPHASPRGQRRREEVAQGAQPLRPPQQHLPQGAERFLGREHGVTVFRAIAPQAPSDHVAAGGGGGRAVTVPGPQNLLTGSQHPRWA